MTHRTPRATQPKRWNVAAVTGAAIGLAVTSAMAGAPATPMPHAAPAQSQLWLASTEGGEGGESGAVAGADPEVAFLAQLAIVEGHLAASALMYRKGMVDDAIGLSYHPEAEMMEQVRQSLTDHGVPDISPAMVAFSETMERGATPDEVDHAMAAVSAAVAAASKPDANALRVQFDAVALLMRAAAVEYGDVIENGTVTDAMPYHEAYGFLAVAKARADALAAVADAKVAAAGQKLRTTLDAADEAFGNLTQAAPVANDPAILLAVAARAELIASAVR